MREKSDGKEGKKPFCQIFTRQPADRREFIEYWRFQGFAYKDVSEHCKTIAKGNFRVSAAFFSHTKIYSHLAVVIYNA